MTEEEFYQNIEEWIHHDISRWNHITLLAYFCHKYQQANGIRFRLVRGKKGPTNGKEAKDFARLFSMLAPENYTELSPDEKRAVRIETNRKIINYINWVFDYKFRGRNQSVNGTQLFLAYNLINEFERMYNYQLQKMEQRDKLEQLLVWCRQENMEILNRHQLERIEDLQMIQKYAESYHLGESSPEVRAVTKAKELGLI